MQKKKGISLIVLVITIIVMIILAAAIVISLNNSGIIGKANTAVKEYNEQEVKHIAEVAWADAYLDGVKTVEGLTEAVNNALTANGVDISKYVVTVTTKGVTVTQLTGSNNNTSVVTWVQDGTSVTKGSTTLTVGQTVTNYTAGNKTWKVLGAENGKLLVTTADTIGTKALTPTSSDWDSTTMTWAGLHTQLGTECSTIIGSLGEYGESIRSINFEDINRVTGYTPSYTDGPYSGTMPNDDSSTEIYTTWLEYSGNSMLDTSSPAYLLLFKDSTNSNNISYWLASTWCGASEYYCVWSLRGVNNGSVICVDPFADSSISNNVRPVVTLSSSFEPSTN